MTSPEYQDTTTWAINEVTKTMTGELSTAAAGTDVEPYQPYVSGSEAAQQYTERQLELQRLSEISRQRGFMRVRDLRPGDEITLTISTRWFDEVHDENFWDPEAELPEPDPSEGKPYTITIRGRVGHIADDIRFRVTKQGKIAYSGDEAQERPPVTGAIIRVTQDEVRTGEDHELHFSHKDPLSEGDEIVLFGTDPNRPSRWTHISGDELRQEEPPTIFNGPFIEEMTLQREGVWTLGLEQMTVNGVPMFSESPPGDEGSGWEEGEEVFRELPRS